jgi:hypothetical protein
MINLIIFIIISISLTNIVVRESIFERPRNFVDRIFHYSLLNKVLQCETCFGFWAGILISVLFPSLQMHWLIGGLLASIANKVFVLIFIKF